MTITPGQARELLDRATPGPWSHDGRVKFRNWRVNYVGPISSMCTCDGLDVSEEDADLAAAAPDLAQTVIDQAATIDGTEWEWGVQHGTTVVCLDYYGTEGEESGRIRWTPARPRAEAWKRTMEGYFPGETYRIVRRLVSTPEVTDGE